MKKTLFSAITLLSLSLILISWGSVGHKKISESVSLSFNSQMKDFQSWVVFLRDHASDADYRKSSDPTEEFKHYIDIDKYAEFVSLGRIPQTFDSVVSIYPYDTVIKFGVLPWATLNTFDSLRNCFQRHDFAKAKIFAADLGHYVADGHMPLHITANYNGQFTGAYGIHSRYESTMIGAYISQITYTGDSISKINDVNQYIFNYLYTNYSYCNSVLLADTYAKTLAGGSTTSSTYKAELWNQSKVFTVDLFKRASHALAELIYTAWIEAGSPSLINATATDPLQLSNAVMEQNTPNPFASSSHINFTLKENTKVLMQVYDINGTIIATLVNNTLPEGPHFCDWTPNNLPSGLYYLVLNTGKDVQVKKMVYTGGK